MTNKKITYVAMLTTASVVIVIILASTTPLLAFPTARIAFEGVLVKLTGLLFGPIIGMITGAVTEFLVTLLRPSYLHWGYTLAIILYGLLGGIAHYIKQVKLHQVMLSNFLIAGIIFVAMIIGTVLIYSISGNEIKVIGPIYLPKWFAAIMLISASSLSLLFALFIPLYLKARGFNNELVEISPILLLAVLTEYFVAITIIPIADVQTLGLNYIVTLVPRIVIAPFEIIANTFVIYTVYKLLGPIISTSEKHNQKSDLSGFWFSKKNLTVAKINTLVNTNLAKRTKSLSKINSTDRLSKLLKKYNLKFDQDKVVLVSGTNGKGSSCQIISKAILDIKNKSVGVFTSPHLFHWNERIQVNGLKISPLAFYEYYKKIENDIYKYDLTFFEIFFLIALMFFNDKKCEYIILESGIGAKQDCCTIVPHKYSIIASISHDHNDILGSKIEDIARDKAHALSQNGVCFANIQDPKIREIFLQRAKEVNNQLTFTNDNISQITTSENFSTHFDYKNESYQTPYLNLAFANTLTCVIETLNCLQVNHNSVKHLISDYILPLRIEMFQKSKTKVILDGAHNIASIENLLASTKNATTGKKVLFIYTSLETKPYKEIYQLLSKNSDTYLTTFPGQPNASSIHIDKARFEKNYLRIFYKNHNDYDYVIFTGSYRFVAHVANYLSL